MGGQQRAGKKQGAEAGLAAALGADQDMTAVVAAGASGGTAEEGGASRAISEKTTRLLWVLSGGRCAICNDYLLEEKYHYRRLNLADRAHISGFSGTEDSPRGGESVPGGEINGVENLMLLCRKCHRMIDAEETKADWPMKVLLKQKREHEDRIFRLTGMKADRETTILRAFGMVRGSVPEMSREQAIQAVIDGGGRFGRFLYSGDTCSQEINLIPFPEPEQIGPGYWDIAKIEMGRILDRIDDCIRSKEVRHLSVFSVMRIPLLVYLGYRLGSKVPTDLYQKHRGAGEGWVWPEEGEPPVQFEAVQIRAGNPEADGRVADQVGLVLSLSGTIPIDHLPEAMAGFDIFEIRPAGGVKGTPDLFRSQATLDSFARTYRDFLARLETTHKAATDIHLFASAPVTASITVGRDLMRHVHPALRVYDRVNNVFTYALTINEREVARG